MAPHSCILTYSRLSKTEKEKTVDSSRFLAEGNSFFSPPPLLPRGGGEWGWGTAGINKSGRRKRNHPSVSKTQCSDTVYMWQQYCLFTYFLTFFRTKSSGQRSFSYQAPTIRNRLPASVRHACSVSSLKSSLKTFLFSKTFSSVPLP